MSEIPEPVIVRRMTAEERKRYPLRMDRAFIVRTARQHPKLSVARIAKLARVPVSVVTRVLTDAGIQRPLEHPGDRLTAAMLRADLKAGLSIQEIARKYRRSVDHMSRLLAMLGFTYVTRKRILREIGEAR